MHAAKAIRGRLKSTIGSRLTDSGTIDKVTLESIFASQGLRPTHIQQLLGPEDEQSVPAMVRLFGAISKISDDDLTRWLSNVLSSRKEWAQQKVPALRILPGICTCLHVHFTAKLAVRDHLVVLSELGHLLMFLFNKFGTAFIASQTYESNASMVYSHFNAVAAARQTRASKHFLFLNNDDRLEGLFG
jgi:hypothetical protein